MKQKFTRAQVESILRRCPTKSYLLKNYPAAMREAQRLNILDEFFPPPKFRYKDLTNAEILEMASAFREYANIRYANGSLYNLIRARGLVKKVKKAIAVRNPK